MIEECYTAGSVWAVSAFAAAWGVFLGFVVAYLWAQRLVRRAIEEYRPPRDWLRR